MPDLWTVDCIKKILIIDVFSEIMNNINEYNKVIRQYGQYKSIRTTSLFQISLLTTFTDGNQINNYSSLFKSKILTAFTLNSNKPKAILIFSTVSKTYFIPIKPLYNNRTIEQ